MLSADLPMITQQLSKTIQYTVFGAADGRGRMTKILLAMVLNYVAEELKHQHCLDFEKRTKPLQFTILRVESLHCPGSII